VSAEHGTEAALRGHYRRGEKPIAGWCQACAAYGRRRWAERQGRARAAGVLSPDRREVRNGLPEFRPYVYRGTGADVLTGASP
jgi:hypothetical protein